MAKKPEIPLSTWISWFAGAVVTAVTLTAFAFTTFRTEYRSTKFEERIDKRLGKIETDIRSIKNVLIKGDQNE